jgi:hypothetical protein
VFEPPRCPYPACAQHRRPEARFYRRHGTYPSKCKGLAVPRFRCKGCWRTFSRQTFCHDYHDKKPHLNAEVFDRLTQSGGLRETGFRLDITRTNLELKARKIARTLALLHQNMLQRFPADACFQLDEMESFEDNRRTRPLTVPILIESKTFFVVAADCAPIRPKGRMTPARKRAIAADEKRYGRRPDGSRDCVRGVLQVMARCVAEDRPVVLRTDRKASYASLARQVFGRHRLCHERVSGQGRRGTRHPLFRINLTNAMSRDYNGRLRRRTWLCSKQGKYLALQLQLFVAYRNYIRPRTRKEWTTPAMLLGLTAQPLGFAQCLRWRQDWGENSLRPDRGGTVSFAEARSAA